MAAILPRNSRVFEPGGSNPATDYFSITPDNAINEAASFRSIYVGAGGDITVVSANGNAVLFAAVPQGTTLRVEGVRVNSTGTTASLLVGLA